MPIGDPHGGNFEYGDEGIPKGIIAVSIPVKDVRKAADFYSEKLKMRILSVNDTKAAVSVGREILILEKNGNTGVDTGIYLKTESPYDLHRRLADEGVVFVTEPKRTELGLVASFEDCDGNVIHAVEMDCGEK